ncbi:aminodeoxychorismate lyase [Arsenicicoccus dermatophilus]|uniref:aminodeoxychorismate lyase n=1 Tax=Arsenicicoccus dermatophilus TaxID=1076331 RepID=UPI001F4CAF95|nr:aminodeoxychorismate lyase [Arsenicicoccus dermatophilus]MCH8614303.1 aminodeoxychorismate lyase [Arsenicicoccus dermatophilus]
MTDAHQVVAVLGRGVVAPTDPVAGADDLGLTRGDGCFDATLVEWDGEGWLVHDLDEHLDRLRRSADALGIDGPDDDDWIGLVGDALQEWTGGDEIGLKLLLTRGDEHRAGSPLAVVTLTEVDETTRRQRGGITVVTLSRGMPSDAFADAPWLLGGVKTIAYAVNVAAKREASRRGADDVIFTSSDGFVLEGPTSAVLWLRDGVLTTTPTGATGILASISRAKVFAQATAAAGWRCEERLGAVDELLAAEGVWLVSSVRGIAPVTAVDGRAVAQDERATAILRELNGF